MKKNEKYKYLMKFEPHVVATATCILQTHKSIAVTKEDDEEMYAEMIGLLRDLVSSVSEQTEKDVLEKEYWLNKEI